MPSTKAKYFAFLAALSLLLFTLPSFAAGAERRQDSSDMSLPVVPATEGKINVDGILDEAAWRDALAMELAYEVEPGENTPAPVRTEVLVTHDAHTLYIGFRCYDPQPAAIRSHLQDRDNLWKEDWVGVSLDTFNDERSSYTFQCNPRGVQLDATESYQSQDTGWDAIWDATGSIEDWGWSVEMAIPFASMRFQRSESGQVWGFDAYRNYPRSVVHQLGLFPLDRNIDCYQCQMQKITGFSEVSPGLNLEFNPTLTAVRTDARNEGSGGGFEVLNKEVEAGLTARYGLTRNMTLGATANPDFSQVEADALKLDINEPFALYYTEKRPFFNEGAEFFQTGSRIVYSRTLRDPSWGFKLTGKEGANSIGALVVRDELTNLIFPGSQYSRSKSLALDSTAYAFRYKRDIGSRYTLGLIGTDREAENYSNRVFGFDGDLRVSNVDRVSFQILGSSTSYPDYLASSFGQPQGSFSDRALNIGYTHYTWTNGLSWAASFRDYGRDFRADLGFIPRVGYRSAYLGSNYRWIGKPGNWWSFFLLGGSYSRSEDDDGNLLESYGRFWIAFEGALQTGFDIKGSATKEGYLGTEFDQKMIVAEAWTSPSGWFYVNGRVEYGDSIDYTNARPGTQLHTSLYVDLKPSDFFSTWCWYKRETLDVEGGRLYMANTVEFSGVLQFSTRMFFRSILQYVDYRYTPELYTMPVDSEYRHLFTQLLFSYKVNPRTVLFIGYSDNYYGDQRLGLTQSDHTFFVKLGYAWVL